MSWEDDDPFVDSWEGPSTSKLGTPAPPSQLTKATLDDDDDDDDPWDLDVDALPPAPSPPLRYSSRGVKKPSLTGAPDEEAPARPVRSPIAATQHPVAAPAPFTPISAPAGDGPPRSPRASVRALHSPRPGSAEIASVASPTGARRRSTAYDAERTSPRMSRWNTAIPSSQMATSGAATGASGGMSSPSAAVRNVPSLSPMGGSKPVSPRSAGTSPRASEDTTAASSSSSRARAASNNTSPRSTATGDSGNTSPRSLDGPSPGVSPRTSPRAPTRFDTFRATRTKVKTPNGTQVPDFANVTHPDAGGCAGWLYKQKAEGRVNLLDGGWRVRYCVWDRQRNRLYYYHYEGEKDHANFVSIDSRTRIERVADDCCPDTAMAGNAFQIIASYTHRPYVFCAGSPEATDEWVRELMEALADAEQTDRAIEESVEQIWESYETSRSNAKLNEPALDVVVEEGELSARAEYFVACYCKGDQKFRTWICRNTDKPQWGCDGSFVGLQEKMRVKLFARNSVTGTHKIIAETVLDLSRYAPGTVVDEWFDLPTLKKGMSARVRLRLQQSRLFETDSINGARGVPTCVLPLRVDTGDIILFHNTHFASQATKVFTRSQWDHVGIVLRWNNNELKLFEATSSGVGLYKLRDRLNFLAPNTKMAVRRLVGIQRTQSMLQALDLFIQQMRGRHYKKRLGVLVKAALRDEKDRGGEDQDLSSVFCSELVVAAYQKMGLLADRFSAKGFLPKDLADKDNEGFPLLHGADLERKRIFTRKKDRKTP